MASRRDDGLEAGRTGAARARDGVASPVAVAVDNEIDRYYAIWPLNRRSLALHFQPEIESRYEVDTAMVRIRELRFTMFLAIGFYYLTFITDHIFVPDIGLTGLVFRVFALPLMLPIFFWRLAGVVREAIVTLAGFVSLMFLATIPSISSAPLAPYAYGTAVLALLYINTTFPVRFYYACVFTAASCALMVSQLFWRNDIGFGLQWTMTLQIAIAGAFSLIANYRIERSVRLAYLLALREALRLEALAADREALAKLSSTDGLTGIANRGHFDRHRAALFSPANIGRDIALLLLDVDFFKRYNDFYGHAAGDACLRQVAVALADGFRDTKDIVARYGGEEFAVLLTDVTPAQAQAAAARICEVVLGLGLPHGGRDDGLGIITVSVGVATVAVSGHDGQSAILIEVADRALYAAKRGGRNRFESDVSLAA